jgi:hypothetical protein
MKDFLKDNTHIREDILNQKLFFELKEASALQRIHLKAFRSDVDVDGFDIIIDNNDDLLLKCQVKSRFDATTAYFDIHRVMMKPNHYVFAEFEFTAPVGCPSDSRGVIQIDGNVVDNKIVTQYYYLDIYLLRAMELGIFKLNAQSQTKAEEILKDLRYGSIKSNEKISILQSLFFPVKDVQALLAIMGFHSEHHINLSYNILEVSKLVSGTTEKKYEELKDRIPDMKGHWQHINEELAKLIHPNNRIIKSELKDNYFDRPPLVI